jgi:metal-dependent amidase/aminoacylase/carboxypeptidase family protein
MTGRGQLELPVTVGIVRIECLMTASGLSPVTGVADLGQLYRDLHANPELSRQEHRTAALAADQLAAAGFDVTTNIGGTGVVGVLANGTGPTALVRADMDALPVREETGLPYASQQRATDRDGYDVPVMHACGHDMHVTCLLGAVRELAASRSSWSGTLMAVFQPAEEVGTGAQAMIDDGLFDRAGHPDVVLGQHVAPIPAGVIGIRPGPLRRRRVHGRHRGRGTGPAVQPLAALRPRAPAHPGHRRRRPGDCRPHLASAGYLPERMTRTAAATSRAAAVPAANW